MGFMFTLGQCILWVISIFLRQNLNQVSILVPNENVMFKISRQFQQFRNRQTRTKV